MTVTKGEQIGPYEVVRALGQGGMAETFVAVRRGPARYAQQVCLKRILPGSARDAMFIELFLDEARLLARMRNRNIVQIYDVNVSDGVYYMATELVDGCDLGQLLERLREAGLVLPLSLALYIAEEVLAALDYAHGLLIDGEPMEIVHRDISPSNILLSTRGEVKLTDFGIAKARGRSHQTQHGEAKGKIGYMSPEQILGQNIDGRSDLFSLGVVLFELLTGQHPFQGTTDYAVQLRVIHGNRPQLGELRPDLEPTLIALVDAMLAPAGTERPGDAATAIGRMPHATDSSFVRQQRLAQLIGAPDKYGVARVMVPQRVDPPLVASATDRPATASSPAVVHASVPAQAVMARPSLSAPRAPRYRWLVASLALVAAAGLTYRLVARAGRTLATQTVPAIPLVEETPPAPRGVMPPDVPRAGSRTAEQAITPVNRAPHAQARSIDEVVSPPKAGAAPVRRSTADAASPPKAGRRPARSVQRAISPHAEDGAGVRSVEAAISPRRAQ